MENQINNTSVEEVQEQTETTEVKAKEEAKTFTQEEVDKIIAKRIAREKKDIEAKIEAERKQAEELAKLSEQEKASKLLEIKEKELEKLLNETSKQLASKNLPTEFAEILKGVDAETTFENIKVFEEKFNAALEVKVNERLRGNVPKTGTVTSGTVNPYDKKTYSLTKQMELEMNNPALAEQLRKSAK